MHTVFLISPKIEYLKNGLKILPKLSYYCFKFLCQFSWNTFLFSLKFADSPAKNQFYTFLEFPDKV